MDEINIIDKFQMHLEGFLNDEGIFPYPCISQEIRLDQDRPCIAAMTFGGPQGIRAAHLYALRLVKSAQEIIYGIDRSTKPNQGTKYKDVLTCAYWNSRDNTWKYGVVNYQYEPKIIDPIDWNNEFWTKKMIAEQNAMLAMVDIPTNTGPQRVERNPASKRPILSEMDIFKFETAYKMQLEEESFKWPVNMSEEEKEIGSAWKKEHMFCFLWMMSQIQKFDCSEEDREQMVEVLHQRTKAAQNPWTVAQQIISNWTKNNYIETPGEELTEQLVREQRQSGVFRFGDGMCGFEFSAGERLRIHDKDLRGEFKYDGLDL